MYDDLNKDVGFDVFPVIINSENVSYIKLKICNVSAGW